MANKNLGNSLRELRKKKGYTQQQVADMLNLKNKSTLGSWEVGKSEPDAYTLLKLCRIYEVENVYTAFSSVTPMPNHEAISIDAKFNLLNRTYQQFIETQIDHLLRIQEEEKN